MTISKSSLLDLLNSKLSTQKSQKDESEHSFLTHLEADHRFPFRIAVTEKLISEVNSYSPDDNFSFTSFLAEHCRSFSSTGINQLNTEFYNQDDCFSEKHKLASYFSQNNFFNQSLCNYLNKNSLKTLKIHEVACGTQERWSYIDQHTKKPIELYCSDFQLKHLKNSKNQFSKTELTLLEIDLLKNFDLKTDRLDFIIASYAFDSFWREADKHYYLIDNQYYFAKYRSVAVNNLKSFEYSLEPVEIDTVDFNFYIKHRLQENLKFSTENLAYTSISISLIDFCLHAFDNHLQEDGEILIFDVGNYTQVFDLDNLSGVRKSGTSAYHQLLDFLLLENIFLNYGLKVKIYSRQEFLSQNNVESSLLPNLRDDNFVLILKK